MSIGRFNERECPPAEPEIRAAIGPALGVWTELSNWMCESLLAQVDFKYMYGKKYGWALRFRIRGDLLTALYPTQNGFTAQVILNRNALEQASQIRLGECARRAIDRAHLYKEGKWLFVPVGSQRDAGDVKRLLRLKVEGGKKRGSRNPAVSAGNG